MTGVSKGRLAILSIPVLALGAPLAAQSTGSLENFRLYGHFSPAVISFDDGVNRHTNAADNAYSGGRVGLWFEVPVQRGRIRFNLETSLGLRQSSAMSQLRVPPLIDIQSTTLRKLDVIFDTERLGSVSFGQGSMASDSVTESDLSNTQLAAYVGISDTAGGYFFRTGSGKLTKIDISSAFPAFDGGRAPRVRWDSPDLDLSRLGTFNLAAATGLAVSEGRVVVNDSLADVGLFYRNRLGDLEIKASAGTSIADDNGQRVPQAAASLSLLHAASGLSVTGAAGTRDDNGEYIYGKVGLKRRWFGWGDTSVSADVYNGIDTVAAGSRADSYGIGIVQDIVRADLQFYLGLRRYSFSQPGTGSYRPSTSVIFGTKWVFKKLNKVHLREGRSELDWQESD
jgi:hypothetical protein